MRPLTRRNARARIAILGAGLAAITHGCSGGDGGPQAPSCAVLSVAVEPGQVTLTIGGQGSAISATLSTSNCATPPEITWSSANPAAVGITGSGAAVSLTALAASATPVTVTATAGGRSGTVQVIVLAPAGIAFSTAGVGFVAVTATDDPAERSVIVTNSGAGTLSGLAVGTIGYTGAGGWLQGTLDGSTANPSVTLTLRATLGTLVPGAYTATVPITSTVPGVAEQTLSVTFIVTVPPVGPSFIAFERWTGTAYPASNGEIWRMAPSGADQLQLTTDGTFDGYPVVSPDRTRIAFTTLRNGNLDLFLMNADGTSPTVLRNTPNPEVGSSWSPDGSQLVYEWFFSGFDVDLHILTVGTGTHTVLVETPQSEEMPTWSPDGTQIAFSKDPVGNGLYAIYRMPVGGGNLVRLTTDASDNFTPAWSPDGSRIAWSSSRSGSYQIYVMDAATGANVVQLTTTGVNIQPTWSPDGTRIAWTSGLNNDWDIWVMNADGSNKVNLTATPATNEAGPSWR